MLLLLHLFCFIFGTCIANDPIVETNYGQIRGFKYDRNDGGKSDIFLGIPFAKPPVGELRLEKPQPPEAWDGVRDALKFGFVCHPHNKTVALGVPDEDCLTLNVMKPESANSDSKLPVLVWIHGGGYEQGSADIYGYKGFANIYNSHDVITVTIQYRLGFLGFFSDGDQLLGNLGSWDQTMALRFLYENIAAFGGDSEKITIFGLSAGGASTSQLSLSPHSNKYFSQCISMSGSAWSNWAQTDYTIKHSLELAVAVGCPKDFHIKECLKSKTMDELFDGIGVIGGTHYSLNMLKFSPRIDGDFFPGSVDEMLKVSKPIPTILGVSRRESLFFTVLGYAKALHLLDIPASEFEQFGEQKLKKAIKDIYATEEYFGSESESAFDHLVDEYINRDKPVDADHRYFIERYSKLLDDLMFHVASVRELIDRVSHGDEVYTYITEHFNQADYPENAPVKGATHVVEYPYIFDIQVLSKFDMEKDEVEQRISKVFRESFINFVKTGTPSNSVSDWERTDVSTLKYLNIGDVPSMKEGFFRHELEFWKKMTRRFGFDMVTFLKTPSAKSKAGDEL